MEEIILKGQKRKETGRENKKFRKEGKIPAVIYGHGFKNINLTVDRKPFEAVYKKAGAASLIDLVVDQDKPVKCLIQAIQIDPATDKFIHIDFYAVKMTEKINAEVGLNFVGEAPAVKELGGVLVKALDHLEVECLPGDLVHEIAVDLSSLKSFEDVIVIKDLNIPEKIKVLKNEDEVVVKVQPPRSEEELKALEEEVEEKVEEVAGVKEEEKKEEGEEGKEEEKKEEGSKRDEKGAKKDE